MKHKIENPFEEMGKGQDTELSPLDNRPQDFKVEREEDLKSLTDTEESELDFEVEGEEEAPEVESPELSEKEELVIEGNVLPIFAEKWKSEGKLPEDFEIKDDLTEEQLDTALYEHTKKNSYTKLKSEIFDEIIESEGLTPDTISIARKIYNGVAEQDLKNEVIYSKIASVKLDPDSDDYEATVKELGFMYYRDIGFSDEKALKHVERDLTDDADSAISDYQGHFREKAIAIKRNNEETENRLQKERVDKRKKDLQSQQEWLEKAEINQTKYTKDQMDIARRAMFEKTEIVTDTNGQQRLVTLEHKKMLEARTDPEKAFQARVNFILGYSPKDAEKDSTIKATNKLAQDLTRKLVTKKKVHVTPRVAETERQIMNERELF